ncbi:MaoC/PaaZ C-terminal domain-containing protein [Mesorhizobium sp. 1B3]|uniref:MaoC/PaaZ C-terminal domain-containing protein n=1 Tax=Mesorhizobium sp. 1B3 TaxID=3243599 RepID=UPI003D955DBE
MTIDYQALKNRKFEPIEQSYDVKDTMLYALGVCCGDDPTDRRDLRFVYEEELQALPTMATVLCAPGFWLNQADTGVNWKQVLHGEQFLTVHRPLAPSGRLIGRQWIEEIVDKGEGRGALIYVRRELSDADTEELVCTVGLSSFARADGGFGGPERSAKPFHKLPERASDLVCDLPTWNHSSLLYRLNGDFNPIHADPAAAASAGFDRPILHGLCTYGVAGHALVRSLCDNDATRLREMNVRFSAPVLPGETIRTEIWREGDGTAGFRSIALERDTVILNNGLVRFV